MASDLHGAHVAAQTAVDLEISHEAQRLAARETYEYAQLLKQIRKDADRYVDEWVDDPSGILSHLFRMCAEPQEDHAEAWRRIVRALFRPQVRAVARYKAEQAEPTTID